MYVVYLKNIGMLYLFFTDVHVKNIFEELCHLGRVLVGDCNVVKTTNIKSIPTLTILFVVNQSVQFVPKKISDLVPTLQAVQGIFRN